MTFEEYRKLAARTINPELGTSEVIEHALYGLPSEVGEITGLFQKRLQGHRIIRGDLAEEIGDALWMLAELCTACRLDMDEVATENIEKLEKRYPHGFEAERSINREE